MSFKGLLCGISVNVESDHNASEWVKSFLTCPNHCLEVWKLSLGKWWCTGQRFLAFTYGSNIYHFLLCGWILESLKIASKSLETFHKWPNRSLLLKKLSSEYLAYILLHLQSLQDFTYMAFKDLFCGTFFVESHHNTSESVETFHTSPNHCLEVKKLSLGQWWCTGQRVLEFTYGSNILSLSFMWLNSWKFENCIGIAWNSSQLTEWVVIAEQI